MAKITKIGIIGCGMVSRRYFESIKTFRQLKIVACADIDMKRAETRAREFAVEAMSVSELLHHPDIEIAVNLTIPAAHVEVGLAAVEAGKHLYSEKPLGMDTNEAGRLLRAARGKNVRIGCAPDTFFGGAHQTCRKIIDDSWIGRPLSGTAFMMSPGPKLCLDFINFFKKGAGPMFDMGPYYVTALVNLLGPIKSVIAKTAISYRERMAICEEHYGEKILIETPTHYAGILEFANGVLITLTISSDVLGHGHNPIEIYGTEGSLRVPDPNFFGGEVEVLRTDGVWQKVPLAYGYTGGQPGGHRGIGIADMSTAIELEKPHRASSEIAFHVLEVMCAFEESSKSGRAIQLKSSCERPAMLPLGLIHGELESVR